jgi:hypothetical protein
VDKSTHLIYPFFCPNSGNSTRLFLQNFTAEFHLSKFLFTINVSFNNFAGFFLLVALGKTDCEYGLISINHLCSLPSISLVTKNKSTIYR